MLLHLSLSLGSIHLFGSHSHVPMLAVSVVSKVWPVDAHVFEAQTRGVLVEPASVMILPAAWQSSKEVHDPSPSSAYSEVPSQSVVVAVPSHDLPAGHVLHLSL